MTALGGALGCLVSLIVALGAGVRIEVAIARGLLTGVVVAAFTVLARAVLATFATIAADHFPSGRMLNGYPCSEILPSISWSGATLLYVPRQYQRYSVDLGIGFAAYQAKFSAKSRSSLRRKLRRFAERSGGKIVWQQYATPDEMEDFYTQARAISALTYQERKLDVGLPTSAAFVDSMRKSAAEARVRGYLLFLEGRAVSFIYCPIDDGVLQYAHVGYDPAIADLSPGTVLQWNVLEALYAEKQHRMFDFTQGEGDHKRFFSTDAVQCANVVILPPSLRSWTIAVTQLACDGASRLAGTILDRFGLKRGLRRLLRR